MTRRIGFIVLVVMVVPGILTACGGSSDPISRGKQVYAKSGCDACHAISGAGGGAAPDQTHLATNAEQRIKDANYHGKATDAAGYIRESIVNPSAYVVSGYADGLMPQALGQQLSPQELDDLVAYLLTLR